MSASTAMASYVKRKPSISSLPHQMVATNGRLLLPSQSLPKTSSSSSSSSSNNKLHRLLLTMSLLVATLVLLELVLCAPSNSQNNNNNNHHRHNNNNNHNHNGRQLTTGNNKNSSNNKSSTNNNSKRGGLFNGWLRRQAASSPTPAADTGTAESNSVEKQNDEDAQKMMNNLPVSFTDHAPSSFSERLSDTFGLLGEGVMNHFRSLRENFSDTVEDLRDTWSNDRRR